MKKNIALFSSVLILGLAALTVGDIEARAEKPLELKTETLATIDAATEKFNVDGVVYTITENTNEVTITNHITNGLAEVVSINEKVTDPNTKIQYTVTGIGTGALGLGAEEKDIVREVSIPKTVLSIGESAFYKRGKISKIQLADGIKTIGRFAFSEVSSLSEIVIPESVTSIGVGAFSGASSLEKVNLPTNITEIPKQLFQNCISLQVFNIPDTITVINESAFSGSGLTEVRIPKGIVEKSGLRAGAFETDTIRKITFTSPIPGGIYTNVFKTPQKSNALFDGWLDDDGDKYEQEDVWKLANDGNITLTATWKTDPNASNISDATIMLLEETGAVSFGSVATDAKMIFNDITLDGTSKTTTEQTASKIKVLDTRQNKTIGWKVGVNYKDTNYIDKKMELILNGSSTNASIVSNSLSLDGTKKDLFTDGATKAESYEVLLNPTLTIPKDFKDTGNQKTQIEWTLEIDV